MICILYSITTCYKPEFLSIVRLKSVARIFGFLSLDFPLPSCCFLFSHEQNRDFEKKELLWHSHTAFIRMVTPKHWCYAQQVVRSHIRNANSISSVPPTQTTHGDLALILNNIFKQFIKSSPLNSIFLKCIAHLRSMHVQSDLSDGCVWKSKKDAIHVILLLHFFFFVDNAMSLWRRALESPHCQCIRFYMQCTHSTHDSNVYYLQLYTYALIHIHTLFLFTV